MSKENKEMYQYYYDYWSYSDWDSNKLAKLTTPELDIKAIRKYAVIYALEYLDKPKKEFYDEIADKLVQKANLPSSTFSIDKKTLSILEEISDEDSIEQIKDILNKDNIDLKNLKNKISRYVKTFRKEEEPLLSQELRNKVKDYERTKTEVILKDDSEISSLSNAKAYIVAYSSDDSLTKEEFCHENNITSDTFDSYVNIVKTFDHKTHALLLEKNLKKRAKERKKITRNLPKLVEILKQYDKDLPILDYYLMSTTPIEELREIGSEQVQKGKLDRNDFKYIEKLVGENKDLPICSKKDIEKLLKEEIKFNIEFDEQGNYIPESGIKPTPEEKENVIEFLKLKEIPVTKKIYYQAMHKYVNGEILKSKSKQKKKWV